MPNLQRAISFFGAWQRNNEADSTLNLVAGVGVGTCGVLFVTYMSYVNIKYERWAGGWGTEEEPEGTGRKNVARWFACDRKLP